jgi:glycosyltransferase involved in cell wall biosynthesis
MRVVLVSHRFPPDGITGVERYTQTLAAQLVRDGHTVAVVARGEGEGVALPRTVRERLPDGAALYRFVGGVTRAAALDRRLEQLFVAVLAEAAPDVVHFNHLIRLTPRFPDLAHRSGAAVVQSLHDFYFACPRLHLQKPSGELCAGPDGGRECARTCFAYEADAELRWGVRAAYFRRLLDAPERLICPSRYVASFFERHGADPGRLRVLPNAPLVERTDDAVPGSLPRTAVRLTLACLGAVVAHKGFHVVIDAARIARLPRVDLRVLGVIADRDYARHLRDRAAAVPGLRLQLYGSYRSAELPFLLGDVDCVVTSSQVAETFSITTREALTLGIPVLAARLGALPEAIEEGVNGYTFAPASAGELATVLRRLDADPALLGRLRAGARRTPGLTLPEHAAAVAAVYEEALALFARGGAAPAARRDELDLLYSHLP